MVIFKKSKKGAVISQKATFGTIFAKSKKGLAFFGLISIFMIIIYFYLLLIYQVPSENLIDEIKVYNKQIENLNKVKQIEIIDNFYINEILTRVDGQVLDSISNFGYLTNSEKLIRQENNCKIGDVNLWYDEREKENNLIKCLPEFEKELPYIFEKIIKLEGEKLKEGENLIFNVKYNVEENIYLVDANSNVKKNSKVGSVISKNNLNFEINLNKFSSIIEVLIKVLPNFSDSNKNKIVKCLDENKENNDKKNSEKLLNCLSKNFVNLIKINNKNLLNDFDVQVNYIEDKKIGGDYFGLNIKIIQKQTKQFITFGLVLKNNIPQSLVSFKVKNYNKADNIIELKIEKPKRNSKIEGYIILYSYENFFDESYNGFNELKEILDSKKVPVGIKEVTFSKNNKAVSLNKGIKYRIFENEKLNINLMNIGSKNFDIDKNEKSIYIFQTYNYKTKKFEKFDLNKKIYFYVFAYDSNYNYYLEKIDKTSIKSINAKTMFGSLPLVQNLGSNTFKGLIISGDNEELENSIKINIPDDYYTAENFDRYDIYIFKDRDLANDKTIKIQCIDSEFKCEYINGNINNKLRTRGLDIILTSSNLEGENVITLSDFDLKNNEKYDVLIVPIDKKGRGILNPTSIEYKIMPKEGDFFYIGTGSGLISPKIKKDVEVKDNKAPNPISSISINNKLNLRSDNKLYLEWSVNNNFDVVSLEAKLSQYDSPDHLDSEIPISISLSDGQVSGLLDFKIKKVIVKDIIPIDSSGNKIDIRTYSGDSLLSAVYP